MDDRSMDSRINSMARRDQVTAVVFVVLLWITLIFVYLAIRQVIPTAGASIVLLISLIVLGIFNTASMIALIRHYSEDKDFIYRRDILHLDENRGLISAREAARLIDGKEGGGP